MGKKRVIHDTYEDRTVARHRIAHIKRHARLGHGASSAAGRRCCAAARRRARSSARQEIGLRARARQNVLESLLPLLGGTKVQYGHGGSSLPQLLLGKMALLQTLAESSNRARFEPVKSSAHCLRYPFPSRGIGTAAKSVYTKQTTQTGVQMTLARSRTCFSTTLMPSLGNGASGMIDCESGKVETVAAVATVIVDDGWALLLPIVCEQTA